MEGGRGRRSSAGGGRGVKNGRSTTYRFDKVHYLLPHLPILAISVAPSLFAPNSRALHPSARFAISSRLFRTSSSKAHLSAPPKRAQVSFIRAYFRTRTCCRLIENRSPLPSSLPLSRAPRHPPLPPRALPRNPWRPFARALVSRSLRSPLNNCKAAALLFRLPVLLRSTKGC